MIKPVSIGNQQLTIPIIQGGMGVGVSLSGLAGAVMREGGLGVISCAHPGYKSATFRKDSFNQNVLALANEVKKARELSEGKGLLGVNIMVASSDYQQYVIACAKMDVDIIICGAGLPLNLPELVAGSTVKLAPIVSSAKALGLILRRWESRYQRVPDLVIIEGAQAGGHLGFKKEDLINGMCEPLDKILSDVLSMISDYEQKFNQVIPVFVAGGIYTSQDIVHYLSLGASGVQIGTRFIATHECDAHPSYKEKYVACRKEDLCFVKSPTGFPGRAIRNDFSEQVEIKGKIPIRFCVNCIVMCDFRDTVYCITDALIKAVEGDVDNGLLFAGENAYRIDKIVSVKELITELLEELQ